MGIDINQPVRRVVLAPHEGAERRHEEHVEEERRQNDGSGP
ncbi:hypothetical protein [Streptomyces chilikensis]|uniref:Uncharacterized protein n=1 Tax=Streptomyces chilikensis TaxID=1194079 RepID=A0ABV3EIL8_9ACTN